MLWIALAAGVAGFAALSRACCDMCRGERDVAPAVLRFGGASGMFAMATLAMSAGASLAAAAAVACGVAITIDLRAVWVRVTARTRRVQSATVTPFQNAT